MVQYEQEKYGWEFLFLGANMDAVAAAERYGIHEDHAVRYECDSVGTSLNFNPYRPGNWAGSRACDRDWGSPSDR